MLLTKNILNRHAGHFGVYPGHAGFDKAFHAQLEFLREHVPVGGVATDVTSKRQSLQGGA